MTDRARDGRSLAALDTPPVYGGSQAPILAQVEDCVEHRPRDRLVGRRQRVRVGHVGLVGPLPDITCEGIGHVRPLEGMAKDDAGGFVHRVLEDLL
nr:hypothetical protein [Halomicrobium urmianum]